MSTGNLFLSGKFPHAVFSGSPQDHPSILELAHLWCSVKYFCYSTEAHKKQFCRSSCTPHIQSLYLGQVKHRGVGQVEYPLDQWISYTLGQVKHPLLGQVNRVRIGGALERPNHSLQRGLWTAIVDPLN